MGRMELGPIGTISPERFSRTRRTGTLAIGALVKRVPALWAVVGPIRVAVGLPARLTSGQRYRFNVLCGGSCVHKRGLG